MKNISLKFYCDLSVMIGFILPMQENIFNLNSTNSQNNQNTFHIAYSHKESIKPVDTDQAEFTLIVMLNSHKCNQ